MIPIVQLLGLCLSLEMESLVLILKSFVQLKVVNNVIVNNRSRVSDKSTCSSGKYMAYTVDEGSKELVGYAIPLYHANQSTICFLENPIFHARTKHMEIHYNLILKKVSQ